MRAFGFYGEAFARWLKQQNEGRPVRYEKVEPGDEQILPPREQRELDALPSGLERKREAWARSAPQVTQMFSDAVVQRSAPCRVIQVIGPPWNCSTGEVGAPDGRSTAL